MSRLDPLFLSHLSEHGRQRSLRALVPTGAAPSGRAVRGGTTLCDFASNDYLGLSDHPALIDRSCAWTREWGTGARASRLVRGSLDIHHAVETKLARLKGTEATLLFASGWQANASVLPALLAADESGGAPLVFTDRLNHASLHHGCAAAGARQIRFRHNDLNHLEDRLAATADRSGTRFIVTESVFSMDGDRADVPGLAALADRFGAFLMLDEAHATGVLGPGGMGLASLGGGRVDLAMGTFSKALGGFGAYVAGSRALCDYLVNRCCGLVYSTAPPPGVLGAMDAALDLVPAMDDARARLHANAGRLRAGLRDLGFDTGGSDTQIVPAIIGEAGPTLDIAQRLQASGFLAVAIRPPTVPAGTGRIRFALSAAHSADDVDALAAALAMLRGSA